MPTERLGHKNDFNGAGDPPDTLTDGWLNGVANDLDALAATFGDTFGAGIPRDAGFNGTAVPGELELDINGDVALVGDAENVKPVNLLGAGTIRIGAAQGLVDAATNYVFLRQAPTDPEDPATWFVVNQTGTAPANTHEIINVVTAGGEVDTIDNAPTGRRSLENFGIPADTDDLPEGATNLYHTTARARAAISATSPLSYNSTTGVLSTSLTQYEDADARAAFSAGVGVDYDDGTGVISAASIVGLGYAGEPTASLKSPMFTAWRTMNFPANLAGSYATALVAATAEAIFSVKKMTAAGSTSTVGTITFAAAGRTGTFGTTAGAAFSLAAGDVLYLEAPGTPDATLADFTAVLVESV